MFSCILCNSKDDKEYLFFCNLCNDCIEIQKYINLYKTSNILKTLNSVYNKKPLAIQKCIKTYRNE